MKSRYLNWAAVVAVAAITSAYGQQPVARPTYEAAAIKPNASDNNNSGSHGSAGQIVFTNQTLKRYVERAYNLKSFQVVGPDWISNIHYDIIAKYPPDTKSDDRMLMLRTLLEDRFGLVVHRETKEQQGYALMVAKSGFKLKPVEAGGSSTNSNGGRVVTLKATKISMQSLADFLSGTVGQLVVDRTDAPGVYDLELHYSTDDQNTTASDVASAPTIFTALQETLGLRLVAQKVPADIVVVDHMERTPTEN